MPEHHNELGQPIGFPIENWQPCEHPRGVQMQGRLCRLEPIDIDAHASDLFDADGNQKTSLSASMREALAAWR